MSSTNVWSDSHRTLADSHRTFRPTLATAMPYWVCLFGPSQIYIQIYIQIFYGSARTRAEITFIFICEGTRPKREIFSMRLTPYANQIDGATADNSTATSK